MKVLLAVSLLLAGSFAQAQHIDSKGREWLSLKKTLHLSAREVRNVCTPVCNGSLAGIDVTGYTWANQEQVLELMKDFEPNAPTEGDVAVFFTASSFAQALGVTYMFNTTYTMSEGSSGLTSSQDASGNPIVGTASYGHQMVNAGGGFSFYPEAGVNYMSRGVFLAKGLTGNPPPPPPPPVSCSFEDQNIPVGSSITRYQSATVPFGQTCQAETRICGEDGVLSGSYTAISCTVLSEPKPQTPVPPRDHDDDDDDRDGIECEQKNKAAKRACEKEKEAQKRAKKKAKDDRKKSRR